MFVHSETSEYQDNVKISACGCGSGGCGCHSPKTDASGEIVDLPDRFQLIEEGDKVVEFGSGSGKDCIGMASLVGSAGKVIGIDKSEDNIAASRRLLDQSGIVNLEFRQGDIENAPVPDEYADIIYSSCVFNLQKNKQKVADEMYRVVKHNG